ncbi:P-loop containing nucleoside triphosphate hydrolase [Pseudocohnilembus persalinus]|uniref:DNA helicase n=1 Tax=Pseudocohnilembus persalinus TaxID=266149 RepID=A0A0V0QL12_PSEPJ|nr:P-loop containing nucleoside triphosphate hydrolase [Pseudocohnilembus persalinus]|eukprot:KRX02914.1 P-loop containing nucleoside triphosphate hydrolase [Pseudocohnilembus persalinus]
MCPTIYGHELMKAGILLSIIGGSSIQEKRGNNIFSSDDSKDFYRQDSHVLLIGDPGLGKSQMLKFVAFITPRSVYVTGNATSNAGLTVSVSRDQSSGESTLEAGALILSDQGVCCIDEFDKMQEQHQSLLEAMEQQTVSLAKSGVLCSLQCRTSIIACANPIGGHYNKQKSIKENIKISNAILSRFDLVFLMLDKADNERDTKLSKHIMKLHNNLQNLGKVNQNQHLKNKNTYNQDEETGQNQQQVKDLPGYLRKLNQETPSKNRIVQDMINQLDKRKNEQQKQNGKFDLNYLDRQYVSFSDKLSKKCQNVDQILDPLIIRKYMSYAKKHIRPTLSSEAADVLKKFYITLRENNSSSSSMPITARQLESLIRLAQARAKIELRNEVTEKDADDVVDLMYESLFDSLEDLNYEGGNKKNINIGQGLKNVDLGNIGTLSKPKQTKIFIQKLQQVANEKNSYEFPLQEMTKIARNMQMNVGDFRMYIEELNSKGTLLHKGQKVYELKEKPFL